MTRADGGHLPAALAITLLGGLVVVAATPARAQMPSPDELIGTWSFDGSCGSSYGMGLSGDGEVWFDEWGSGLWVVDGGAILMILQESEIGIDEVIGVTAVRLRVDGYHGDRFDGTFLQNGLRIQAVRCG